MNTSQELTQEELQRIARSAVVEMDRICKLHNIEFINMDEKMTKFVFDVFQAGIVFIKKFE